MTLRIDYSSYLSKIFKARLLHDLERQPLIRATKETSIDREDLIICVAIWTLYKLCLPLICDEFRVRSIASRDKFRFTSLLGPIFKDFGRFWEANLEGKIDF